MLRIPDTLQQTALAGVVALQATNSTTWVPLISTTITTGLGNFLVLIASFSLVGTLTANADFRLVVDSVARRGTRIPLNSPNLLFDSGSIVIRIPITRGSHTVELQWQTTAGTVTIDPAVDGQSASILMKEVTV